MYTVDIEANLNDYVIKFLLDFLEACCMNEELTIIICRVLINHLFNKMLEEEVIFTQKH